MGSEPPHSSFPSAFWRAARRADAPFPYDRVERVDVYIVSVSGSLTPDTSTSGTFVTLATPNRRINLLDLQNGVTEDLGEIALAEGVITAVRVVIDTDSSSITLKDGRELTATSTPGIAWQSSPGRPTLTALIEGQIDVPDSGGTVVIDYDVGRSFITPQEIDPSSTDSGFIFSPVLRAADRNRTGAIGGVVVAAGQPVEDAAASTYIVAIDPPAGSGLGRVLLPDLTVAAGVETPVGTVTLP